MKKTRAIFWSAFAAAMLAAAWPLLVPAPKSDLPLAGFSRLPVLEGGRVKPLDSFARNSLLVIRGTQSLSDAGKTLSAVEWLLEALFRPEAADIREIFLIDDPDVLGLLGLEQKQRRFAYWQIEPKRDEIGKQAQRALALEASNRSRFQTSVVNLSRRLDLYEQIKNTIMISGSDDPAAELSIFASVIPGAMRAIHNPAKASVKDRLAMKALSDLLERYRFLKSAAAFRPLAPRAGQSDDAWMSFGEAVLKPSSGQEPHPGLASYALMARAYRKSDAPSFRFALAQLSTQLEVGNRAARAGRSCSTRRRRFSPAWRCTSRPCSPSSRGGRRVARSFRPPPAACSSPR
jgi:hypothetical protein